MTKCITVEAPAKINIGLEVLSKRDDGYHGIKSVFTTVNLADVLSVWITDVPGTCSVECDSMVLPDVNTFTLAYEAFCVLTGVKTGVHVKVDKHIPSGGGLGGGSSDASSFIQSLNTLFSTHLKPCDLLQIAGKVGSDVFFFTQALIDSVGRTGRYTAVVEGRGEIIRQIHSRDDYDVLLLFPNVGVSTKDAYRWVDESRVDSWESKDSFDFEQEYRKSVKEWAFVNDFTSPVCEHVPSIRNAIEDLRSVGADFADMSGSGSTVFGIFCRDKNGVSVINEAFKLLSDRWSLVIA